MANRGHPTEQSLDRYEQELADTLEAEQLRRRPSSYRCPSHGNLVGIRAGHLHGRCPGCAAEAARGIHTLTSRTTTAARASDSTSKRRGRQEDPL